MRQSLSKGIVTTAIALAGTVGILSLTTMPTAGQAPYRAPRAPDGTGKPNVTGFWQAINTANWNIQDHAAGKGPVPALGAAFGIPGGRGVVEGNDIPYRPEALATRKENAANWMTADPELKCYLPGVPRATYMPYPFEIVQTPDYIFIGYEFAAASRIIPVIAAKGAKKMLAPSDFYMGWSHAHWEGDTLVIDVTAFNDKTWFDRAGNYHSDALHVVERFTPMTRDALHYEATIEDPKVFTRPWKMSMVLYRLLEKNAELFEYKCVEMAEEMMYGPLNVTKPRAK
jgi:hypothetical protein